MPRYIDADKLRDEVDDTLNWETNNEYNMYSDIMDMIDYAPTEDVQPVKHGHWVWKSNYRDYDGYICSVYSCSVCSVHSDDTTNFCPNCGARMDGDRHD